MCVLYIVSRDVSCSKQEKIEKIENMSISPQAVFAQPKAKNDFNIFFSEKEEQEIKIKDHM